MEFERLKINTHGSKEQIEKYKNNTVSVTIDGNDVEISIESAKSLAKALGDYRE